MFFWGRTTGRTPQWGLAEKLTGAYKRWRDRLLLAVRLAITLSQLYPSRKLDYELFAPGPMGFEAASGRPRQAHVSQPCEQTCPIYVIRGSTKGGTRLLRSPSAAPLALSRISRCSRRIGWRLGGQWMGSDGVRLLVAGRTGTTSIGSW